MVLHLCGLLAPNLDSMSNHDENRQTQIEGHSTFYILHSTFKISIKLKTFKVTTKKGHLRNCHSPEEYKKT